MLSNTGKVMERWSRKLQKTAYEPNIEKFFFIKNMDLNHFINLIVKYLVFEFICFIFINISIVIVGIISYLLGNFIKRYATEYLKPNDKNNFLNILYIKCYGKISHSLFSDHFSLILSGSTMFFVVYLKNKKRQEIFHKIKLKQKKLLQKNKGEWLKKLDISSKYYENEKEKIKKRYNKYFNKCFGWQYKKMFSYFLVYLSEFILFSFLFIINSSFNNKNVNHKYEHNNVITKTVVENLISRFISFVINITSTITSSYINLITKIYYIYNFLYFTRIIYLSIELFIFFFFFLVLNIENISKYFWLAVFLILTLSLILLIIIFPRISKLIFETSTKITDGHDLFNNLFNLYFYNKNNENLIIIFSIIASIALVILQNVFNFSFIFYFLQKLKVLKFKEYSSYSPVNISMIYLFHKNQKKSYKKLYSLGELIIEDTFNLNSFFSSNFNINSYALACDFNKVFFLDKIYEVTKYIYIININNIKDSDFELIKQDNRLFIIIETEEKNKQLIINYFEKNPIKDKCIIINTI